MLEETEIGAFIQNELDSAISYEGEIAKKRAKLMDYYNAQPYGDEVDGQSSVVTTDVADQIEWMLPSLLRVFVQGQNIAHFDAVDAEDDEEAKEKTFLANYTFLQQSDGVRILHDMFKDALLQYTGVVKVYWDDDTDTKTTKYRGLSELEYQKLKATEGVKIEEVETEETELGTVYNCESVEIKTEGRVKYDNIPPEEFLISKTARNFNDPVFIGHRSPKTRSDLVEMGFDKKKVDALPADEYYAYSDQKNARYHDYDNWQDINASGHSPNDIIYLGEYYAKIDVNEDGITELWQVLYAGQEVLSKEQVEEHPFAVCVPIPIPHRAIGTCPAEQVADIQFRKSTLVRQMLNNIYQSNYPRILHSNKVELDDLLTPRAGGLVGIDSDAPDVAGHAQMLQIQPQIEGILAAIEYTDTEKELRTGVTRYNQGLDAESLNKTATGFLGIRDSSQQRMDLIARLFADGGVKQIFVKTVSLLSKYQDDAKTIRVMGKPLEIDPREWGTNQNCRIDVGIGSGDRMEKIANLNSILQKQVEFKQMGLVLADQPKMYNTLEKLITEIGLKDASRYFNNPEVEEQTLFAQNQQMAEMLQQYEANAQNPLVEAEQVKSQGRMAEATHKSELDAQKFMLQMQAEMRQHSADMAARLTEMELKYGVDLPGGVDGTPSSDTATKNAKARKDNADAEAQELENMAVKNGMAQLIEIVQGAQAG